MNERLFTALAARKRPGRFPPEGRQRSSKDKIKSTFARSFPLSYVGHSFIWLDVNSFRFLCGTHGRQTAKAVVERHIFGNADCPTIRGLSSDLDPTDE